MKPICLVLAGLIMTTLATAPAHAASDAPAASLAFTSRDPIVRQARGLMDAGKFSDAETLLNANTNAGGAEAARARVETLDIIGRTRFEYSQTPGALLEKVQISIPDVTAAELELWTAEARLRFRLIDGQKFYFRREPQNLWIFSKEAIKRREAAGNAPRDARFDLVAHLKAVADEADRTGKTEVLPVHHKITHTLIVRPNQPGVKEGSLVRVWLPFPQEYRQQRDVKLTSASPEPKFIAPSAIDGNPVTGSPQRTVYFEQRVTDPAKPIEFTMVLDYDEYAYYPKLEESKAQPLPADWNGAFLNERLPHLAFTPEIRAQVAEVVGTETNSLVKARKLFRWVSANIPWNAEDEYSIIPSFAIKGFTAKRGDCGVQNSIYITMCRIAGVPARWQSGFETKPGKSWGMHDWAEIYIAPWGWLPADASYGVKESDDPRIADFYCGHQDSYRMIVNLDWGRELNPPKQSLRSEPGDFQRGEVEIDGKNLYYNQWEYKMEADRTPVNRVE